MDNKLYCSDNLKFKFKSIIDTIVLKYCINKIMYNFKTIIL